MICIIFINTIQTQADTYFLGEEVLNAAHCGYEVQGKKRCNGELTGTRKAAAEAVRGKFSIKWKNAIHG